MTDAVLRPALPADVPAIEEIAAAAYAPYVARIGREPGPMRDDYAARVAEAAVTVAEDGEGVCGYVVLLTGDGALLDNVAVADRARGTGLGRRLIAHAEDMARAAGFPAIRLYTHVAMTENRALYPRLGYRATHRATEHGFERVYFAKDLPP